MDQVSRHSSISSSSDIVETELSFTGLTPLTYNTIADLEQACETIYNTINDTSQQWNKRCDALKQIVRIAVGNTYTPQFLSLLNKQLRDAIVLNLHDLRSAVARDACICVCSLSVQYGDCSDINIFADNLVPQLFKSLVGAAVIATTSDRTVKCIIKNNKLNKAIGKICESCYSLDVKIRTACMQYLLQVIENQCINHEFSKHCDVVEKCIKDKLSDKSDQVRVTARQCYIAYNDSVFGSRGIVLWDTFDDKTKKLINEERLNTGLSTINRPSRSSSCTSNLSILAKRDPIKSSTSFNGTAPAGRYSISNIHNDLDQSPQSTSSTPELQNRIISDPAIINTRAQSAYTTNTQYKIGVPVRVLNHTNNSLKQQENNKQATDNTAHHNNQRNNQENARLSVTHTVIDQPSSARPPINKRVSVGNTQHTQRPQSTTTQRPHGLTKLLDTAKSTDWLERVTAFTNLCTVFQSLNDMHIRTDVQIHIDKIMTVHLERVNDAHIKVATAALSSLHALLQLNQCTVDDIKPYMERLLPCLFDETSNKQSTIVDTSKQCLTMVAQHYTADYLFTTILRLIDNLNMKCKQGCVEFIVSLLTNTSINNQPSMADVKRLYVKLIAFIQDNKCKAIRDINVQCLCQLYSNTSYTAIIGTMISALPSTEYSIVLRAISNVNLTVANQLVNTHTQVKADQETVHGVDHTTKRKGSVNHTISNEYQDPLQVTLNPQPSQYSSLLPPPTHTTNVSRSNSAHNLSPIDAINQSVHQHDSVMLSPQSPNSRYITHRNAAAITHTPIPIQDDCISDVIKSPNNQRPMSTPSLNPILSAYYNSLTASTATLLIAIKQLNVALRDNNVRLDQQFDRLHQSLISLCSDPNIEIRDTAMQGILILTQNRSYVHSHVDTHVTDSLHALLTVARTQANAGEQYNNTEAFIITLCDEYASEHTHIPVLVKDLNTVIGSEHHEAVLKISLNSLISLINNRMDVDVLLSCITDMVDGLSSCVTTGGQSSVIVRKLSINAFVAMYSVIGNQLFQYTQSLNMVTSKLVTIYCDKYKNDVQRHSNIVA